MRKSVWAIPLVLVLGSAASAVATTHNDCRVGFRECMKAKKSTQECLKPRRDCEARVRAELKDKKGGNTAAAKANAKVRAADAKAEAVPAVPAGEAPEAGE
jgi:hypothetical protein